MNFRRIFYTALVIIFFSPLYIFPANFMLPEGHWKEKKGAAELTVGHDHLLFRKTAGEEFKKYPVEVVGQVRNEYWLKITGKMQLQGYEKILIIYRKYSLELTFYSENKAVLKYTFEK